MTELRDDSRPAGNARVLIIEDSRFLRKSLEKILYRAGYEVLTADQGQQGLEMARANRPDAIFLDLLLPVLSGIDVLRTLRQQPETKNTPVLVLSGLSQQNSTKLHKDGATLYVEKKESMFSSGENSSLLTTLREILGEKSKSDGDRKGTE